MADLGNSAVLSQNDASNGSGTMPSWLGSAAPSTLDDAGRALQGAVTREWNWRNVTLTAAGTADVKTLTYSVAPAAYYNGQKFAFIANTTNTTTVTLNVNGLGAKTIKKMVRGTAANLDASEMYNNAYVEVTYNSSGDYFVWTNYDYSILLTSATADVTPTGSWSGQLNLRGSGYFGGIALNATGLWLGHNSSARAIILAQNNTEKMRLDTSGNFTMTSGSGLIGYGAGTGGTVTQTTDKGTSVAINKQSGQITMNNAALGPGAKAVFAVSNTTVSATDTVIATIGPFGTGSSYRVNVSYVNTNTFYLMVENITDGSLSDAVVINFAVIKAATS